ncbi:MAG: hypothetical protein OXC40_07270, partial [Proteobacteria bacterium]|nr:hypothetical protein [Pseudomonadota bacterium]
YIYVAKKSAQKKTVSSFILFYLKHVATLVQSVGYVAMSESAYQRAVDQFISATKSKQMTTPDSQPTIKNKTTTTAPEK